MYFSKENIKAVVCCYGIFMLAGCAGSPPKPPEVVGDYRPLNKINYTIKAETNASYTATLGATAKAASVSKESDWEILATDGTLRKTLERWAQMANWEIVWTDLPEFKNPGYVKLEKRDFLSACDYVLSKAKTAAKEAGFEIFITAYPNRVLVISKEAPQ